MCRDTDAVLIGITRLTPHVRRGSRVAWKQDMPRYLLIPLIATLTLTGVDGKDRQKKARTPEKSASTEFPRATQGHRGQDLNGDGKITREEWPGDDKSFRKEDTNHDGVLTDADRRLKPRNIHQK